MKKLLALSLFTLFSLSSQAILLEDSVVTGRIKKFDAKTVTIVDHYQHEHVVARKDLPKGTKVSSNVKVSIGLKVKPEQFKFSQLPYKLENISKLKEAQLKKLVLSYQVFIYTVDKQLRDQGGYNKKTVSLDKEVRQFFDFILSNAYADDPAYTCFYGGWPTNASNAGCRPPWNSTLLASIDSNDPMKYEPCGGPDNVYRCNPVLFGPSIQTNTGSHLGSSSTRVAGSSVRVRSVPAASANKGICVEVTSTRQMVDKCIAASRANLGNIIHNIQEHPEVFQRFAASVETFCRGGAHSSNAACGNLRNRLAAIEFGRQNGRAAQTAGTTCTSTLAGNFGQSAGSGDSCPGNLCFVQANCAPAAAPGGAAASPTPITAVCGCSILGATDSNPDAGHVLACINDQSIAVLNQSTAPAAGGANPADPGAGR